MTELTYSNIRKICEICDQIGSVERHETDDPLEGFTCSICERWVCVDCACFVDSDAYTSYCKDCCSCADEYRDDLNIKEGTLDKNGFIVLGIILIIIIGGFYIFR